MGSNEILIFELAFKRFKSSLKMAALSQAFLNRTYSKLLSTRRNGTDIAQCGEAQS